MVVKEQAQVSVPSQLQQPRTEMFYSPWDFHQPNQSSTHSLKTPGSFLIFYFYCSVEKQMLSDGYFTMDLALFRPPLKAAAKAAFVVLFLSFLVLRWLILKVLQEPWDGGMFLRLKQAAKAKWNVFTQYLCMCTGMYDCLLAGFHMAKNCLLMP